MQGRRYRYTWFALSVLVATAWLLAMTVDGFLNPAHAAGQSYSPIKWAGTRVPHVRSYGGATVGQMVVPTGVGARWKIPCLPSSADGVYGDIDMWIGMESADGSHLIQIGIRGWHHIANGIVINDYWGWAINTHNPNFLYPVARFTVDNCGPYVSNATVDAQVYTNGYASIQVTNPSHDSTVSTRAFSMSPSYPMSNPGSADYVIERPNSAIPNFGTATFLDCKAFYGGSTYTPAWGNPDVEWRQFNMYTSVWYGSSYYIPNVAVQTYAFDGTGNFSLRRLLAY
jgi:Peptidase A4 family